MKTTSNHTHNAWVSGYHELPEGWDIPAGMVLIQDLGPSEDEWSILDEDRFDEEFDWIIVEETVEAVDDYEE
jgi:hypothetical protein